MTRFLFRILGDVTLYTKIKEENHLILLVLQEFIDKIIIIFIFI